LLVALLILALAEVVAENARPGRSPARWSHRVATFEEALRRGDTAAAGRAWTDLYRAARASRPWETMLEAGDRARRLGEVTGDPGTAAARARDCYLTALFRARQQGSLDGALRAGDGFAALGDTRMLEEALRIARALAAQSRDPRPGPGSRSLPPGLPIDRRRSASSGSSPTDRRRSSGQNQTSRRSWPTTTGPA
jgi:hypothetical protein